MYFNQSDAAIVENNLLKIHDIIENLLYSKVHLFVVSWLHLVIFLT